MNRDLIMDFRQGGGSLPEVVFGIVRVWGTESRIGGNGLYVTTAETTLKLNNGQATISGMLTNGVGPLYKYAYIVQVEPFYGHAFRIVVGLPDGTTPINLVNLPRLGFNNEDGFYVDIEQWEAIYGTLPSRVSALESGLTTTNGRVTALEVRSGGLTQATQVFSTANANTYTTPGIYTQVSGSTTALNWPVAGTKGTLFVVGVTASNLVHQEFYPSTGSATTAGRVAYVREMLTATTWSAWRASPTTRVDQTAGRTIYQWDDLNSRDQRVYGDTGWRSLSLGAGAVSGVVQVRRVGNIVTAKIIDVVLNGTNRFLTNNVGNAGFNPSDGGVASNNFAMGLTISGTDTQGDWHRVNAYRFGVQWQGTVRTGAVTVPAAGLNGQFSWMTDDAWPTTLPGTAVGTIPNL